MSAVKVLLAGDCLGGFEALFKKVAAVNKKNGPFDLLLCVGQFFEEASELGWSWQSACSCTGACVALQAQLTRRQPQQQSPCAVSHCRR